jgi:hypothetical protein
MRVVVQEYAKGGRSAYETSNDGRDFLGEWDGQLQPGERLCAFIEAACESNDEALQRLIAALEWVTAEIKKRKASAANEPGESQPAATAKRA